MAREIALFRGLGRHFCHEKRPFKKANCRLRGTFWSCSVIFDHEIGSLRLQKGRFEGDTVWISIAWLGPTAPRRQLISQSSVTPACSSKKIRDQVLPIIHLKFPASQHGGCEDPVECHNNRKSRKIILKVLALFIWPYSWDLASMFNPFMFRAPRQS